MLELHVTGMTCGRSSADELIRILGEAGYPAGS